MSKTDTIERDGLQLHPVRVRIREVPYAVRTKDILGGDQIEQRSGFGPGRPEIEPSLRTDVDEETALKDYQLGQLIELMDPDYIRLKNAGCVYDVGEAEEIMAEAVKREDMVRTASVEELAEWISTAKPKINEVVQASNGEPELAQKLLEAEMAANDGNPRDGVLKGLGTVISRG